MRTTSSRAGAIARLLAGATVLFGVLAPESAFARQGDAWEVTVAPLYLWATKIDGDVTALSTTVPVFLSFADAADDLAGAFSFHVEARKGRWGLLTDLNFVRLSSDAQFTIPGAASPRIVDGTFQMDNTTFEAGGSYLVSEAARFAVIGGLRTFSLSPKLEFTSSAVEITPIDASRTVASGFAGFTYRPRLAEKWTIVSRADIGGGSARSWSGMLGLEFRPTPRVGLVFGYKALGIDAGDERDDHTVRELDLTYYGPIVGLNLHWGGR